MDKFFICLANSSKRVDSKKHGDETGRCIAGVEVDVSFATGKAVIKSIIPFTNKFGSRPNWIRPKGQTETGAIPIEQALPFKIFDLIKLSDVTSTAEGAHSEDYKYRQIERITNLKMDNTLLEKMCDNLHRNYIFGNSLDTVPDDRFLSFDHSLMLIKPITPKFYFKIRQYNGNKKKQLRCKFKYGSSAEYDLVVTDPLFKQKCFEARDDELCDINTTKNYFFVMSIGIALSEQNNKHYKLIASVLNI